MIKAIFKILVLSLFIVADIHLAYAQSTQGGLVPNGKTTFLDQNGKPLTKGQVYFYTGTVGSTTPKTTYQDIGLTTPNSNPVILDAAGRALIWGTGTYRQQVRDQNNNIIWDVITSAAGSGTSGGSTATGDGDLVGTIKPWGGPTAPNQYMFTYGQEVNRTTYAALFTAITSTQSVFCTSGSPTLNGVGDTTNFWIGMKVEIPCVPTGISTVASKTSSTVTLAVNANVSENINATFFMWGNGNGSTTFNLPDFRGLFPIGNNNMGGVASSNISDTYFGSKSASSSGGQGGGQSVVLTTPNLPPYTPNVTVSQQPAFGFNYGAIANGQVGGSNSFVNGFGSGTPVTTTRTLDVLLSSAAQGGTSTAFGIIPPSKTVNYIIKVTPDANSATANGVASLGGMTGSIGCGTGLSCTGNIISVSIPNVTVATIPSIAQLRATTIPPSTNTVYVAGYSTLGDGGQGIFEYNSTSSAADNGGTIIAPTVGSGRWIRSLPLSNTFAVEWFGANVSNVDNTSAIQSAVNAIPSGGSLLFQSAGYNDTGTVTISNPITISCPQFSNSSTGNINATGSGNTIFAVTSSNVKIDGCYLNRSGAPAGTAITVGSNYTTITDGQTTASGTTLTSPAQANFTSADIGKQIACIGAGAGGIPLLTTISAFISNTQVTLASAAGSSVNPATCNYGTMYNNFIMTGGSIANSALGLLLQDASQYHVNNVYFNSTNPVQVNNVTGQGGGASDFSGNTFLASNSSYGVVFNSGADVRFVNNKFLGGIYNFYMNWNFSSEGNLLIQDSSLENCQTSAIFISTLASYERIVISGNSIACTGAGGAAIATDNNSVATFNDLIIANNTIRGSSTIGVSVGKTNQCLIQGNQFDLGGIGGTIGVNLLSNSNTCQIQNNYYNVSAGKNITNLGTNNFIDEIGPILFANIPANMANGSRLFISDASPGSNPCSGSGTGSTAFRQNGAWVCNGGLPIPVPFASGGTNNTATYSTGSVPFSDGTKLTQDTNNFYWDGTNHRICVDIGVAGCSFAMSVIGVSQWGVSASGSGIRYQYGGTTSSGTDILGINYNNNTFNSIGLSATGNDDLAVATTGAATSRISLTTPQLIANGTVPTGTTGSCSASSFTGGSTAGKFTAPTCSGGTIILSALPSAPNGYTCVALDQTTSTNTLKQTANSVTSVTFTSTTTLNDVVVFDCKGW